MASGVAVFFLLVLASLCILAVWHLGVAVMYRSSNGKNVITRGMTGMAGQTVSLSCPTGKVISVERATFVCNDLGANQQPTCDPNNPDGTFNTANVVDATDSIATAVNGKTTGEYAIPASVTALCGGKCNSLGLIGTYDCK